MLANIANFVRQEIRVPYRNALLPIFEAVTNSLDAIKDAGRAGEVRVTFQRDRELDGSPGRVRHVIIEDDGIGFTDDNMSSFNELFSDRKVSVGGKGRGRFTFLKVFGQALITSRFDTPEGRMQRQFDFDMTYGGNAIPAALAEGVVGTRIELRDMHESYAKEVPQESDTIVRRFIWHFLPLILSANDVEIIIDDLERTPLIRYVKEELEIDLKNDFFDVAQAKFTLTHVLLQPKPGLKHRMIMAASSREVDDGIRLAREIPVLAGGALPHPDLEDGFIYVALVQGKYLDDTVDPLRLAFTTAGDEGGEDEEAPEESGDLFGQPRSIGQVRREALKLIKVFLKPYLESAVAERVQAVEAYIHRDGMGYHFLRPLIPEIAESLKGMDDAAIENSLHRAAYDERRRRTKEAQRLLATTPKEKSEQAYFDRWHEIVGKLSDVAKSDLAEHVAHRRAIIDLIDDVIKATEEGSHRREEILHSIVFPKGKQSGDVSYEQQNLWLIDERLAFHDHLFSDKTIKSISKGEIDSARRPDLAIFESGFAAFAGEGKPPATIVLVELKRPARRDASRDDPVGATLEYVRQLKSGRAYTEREAVIDVQENALTTVYLLADWTADFKGYMDREEFKEMPGDHGRYRYRERENIMFLAFSFKRLIENAKMRNRIFFRRLGIE